MAIDDIPWAKLRHAYGPATDVPEQLRDLVSSEVDKRMEAFGELCGNVWHQGTVYEVTPFVVPLLIGHLRNPSTPDPGLIVTLLASIACGTGYFTRHIPIKFSRSHWEQVANRMGRSLDDLMAEEARIVTAVRDACREYIPEFLPFMRNPEAEVRLSVVEALRAYPEHRALTIPALRELKAIESEEEVMQAIIESLSELEEKDAG